MPTIGEVHFQRAKDYILAHPDESKAMQAEALGVSATTVARARRWLIKHGLMPPSRKASLADTPTPRSAQGPPIPERGRPAEAELDEPDELPQVPAPRSIDQGVLDHEAMAAIAALGEDDPDDERTLLLMMKQCRFFAFNPSLHPDTRMSASQMWSKLRDQKRVSALGPGAPLTREDAVDRLRELMIACGPDVVFDAVNAAFKEAPPNAEAKTQQAQSSAGTPAAPVAP